MGTKININSYRQIGDGEPVYIIAEGGDTNWGELELAKKQVDMAMAAGADATKFQSRTTEELVSQKVDPYWYKRMKYKEMSYDNLLALKEYCSTRNIDFFVTAHTELDLEFIDTQLQPPCYKIGSGESLNFDLLSQVGELGKPIFMSLGLHLTDDEIRQSVSTLEKAGATDIILMHCNTVYPTPPDVNYLSRITHLKNLFPQYIIGYSDHTIGYHMPLAAVALGAMTIEKHLSFDKNDKRSLDCPVSCDGEDLKNMVAQIREIEAALKDPGEKRNEPIRKARTWAHQSAVARRDIAAGEMIVRDMITFKRPGKGIPPTQIDLIVGKSAKHLIEKDMLVLPENLQ